MSESSAPSAGFERPLHLERSIPLSGAIFTLIGYIIGGSIFILPGELAAQAGPGVFLAYLLASGIALFVCVIAAQIGNAFPVSGANYVAVSTVLSPFWGFPGGLDVADRGDPGAAAAGPGFRGLSGAVRPGRR